MHSVGGPTRDGVHGHGQGYLCGWRGADADRGPPGYRRSAGSRGGRAQPDCCAGVMYLEHLATTMSGAPVMATPFGIIRLSKAEADAMTEEGAKALYERARDALKSGADV